MVAMTGQSIAQLVNPAHTLEVLNNSTSIVGISVISAQAAARGPYDAFAIRGPYIVLARIHEFAAYSAA